MAAAVTALSACTAKVADISSVTGNASAGAEGDAGSSATVASAQTVCVPTVVKLAAADGASRTDLSDAKACSESNDALDDALTSVKLDRCGFGVDPATALSTASWARPEWLAPALQSPLAFSKGARNIGAALDQAASSATPVTSALLVARGALGGADAECFDLDSSTLSSMLKARSLVASADQASDSSALAALPPAFDGALGSIFGAILAARDEVTAATPLDSASRASLENTVEFALYSAPRAPSDADVTVLAKVDMARIARAATRLSAAIENAGLDRFAGLDIPSLTVRTTAGDIVIRGAGVDKDSDELAKSTRPVLLWIDTGGNDVHRTTAGGASATQLVSVMLDLGGDDQYGYAASDAGTSTRLPADEKGRLSSGPTASRVPRQGGAFFGIGLSFDFGSGNDTYRSLAMAQGAGALGVGVLFDQGGNDDARAEVLSQGAAVAGVGLLVDGAGNDVRRTFIRSQGYGATGGVGILSDQAGNDTYFADPGTPSLGGDLLYPSALLDGKNVPLLGNQSNVQGAGEGRRGVTGAYAIVSGGLGILRDRSGDDHYQAGAFAQGSGLEEGVGALLDDSGADDYEALAYAQGAGIHRALGLLVDGSGNDSYNATYPIQATSLGVGHDYGVGMLADLGGADDVHAPTLALGAGSANGAGLFLASGGDDAFTAATAASFGTAIANGITGARTREATVGVFVKAAGTASYTVGKKRVSHSSSLWTSGGDDGKDGALLGVAIDAPSGRTAF